MLAWRKLTGHGLSVMIVSPGMPRKSLALWVTRGQASWSAAAAIHASSGDIGCALRMNRTSAHSYSWHCSKVRPCRTRDPWFETLGLFDPPARAERPLKELGHCHKRDGQGVSFDVRSVGVSQWVVLEQVGENVGIKQESAHCFASPRSSFRRA